MDSQLLREIRSALASRGDVQLAFLFGSAARGEESSSSDLDLAIEGSADPLELAADLSLELAREIDVVRLESVSIPLLRAILQDAVVVREGRAGAEADFRSRALAALDLDLEWYESMRRAYVDRVASKGLG